MCLSYKVHIKTTWTFGKFPEESVLILRVSLWLFCVRHFQRRLWSCHRTWWQFPRDLDWMFCPIFSEVSVLVSRLKYPYYQLFLAAFLWEYYLTLVTLWKGLQSFQRYCFAIARGVPRRLLLVFYYLHVLIKEVSRVCLTFSVVVFIYVAIFPLLLSEKKRIKKRQSKKLLALFFGFLIIGLPCHVLTLKSAIHISSSILK